MKLKRTLAQLIAAPIGYSWPIATLARHKLYDRYNIIYYHFIGEPTPYYGLDDAGYVLSHFKRDILKLERYFKFVPIRDLLSEPWKKGSKPMAALTFDDGFDMITNGVMDFLDTLGISATTFVITSCVDNRRLMWRNKLMSIRQTVPTKVYIGSFNELARRHGLPTIAKPSELLSASATWPMSEKERWVNELWAACGMEPEADFLQRHHPYFTSTGLKEWVEHGHSIGLHTDTHVFCDRLNAEEIQSEIVAPAQLLKAQFDIDWLPFAYPFGNPLKAETARHLCSSGLLSCLLGVRGFARRGTPPYRLERANAQGHYKYEVFGNVLASRKVEAAVNP